VQFIQRIQALNQQTDGLLRLTVDCMHGYFDDLQCYRSQAFGVRTLAA